MKIFPGRFFVADFGIMCGEKKPSGERREEKKDGIFNRFDTKRNNGNQPTPYRGMSGENCESEWSGAHNP